MTERTIERTELTSGAAGLPGGPSRRPGRAAKIFISLFVVLNLTCVMLSNEPEWFESFREGLGRKINPQLLFRLQQVEWRTRHYAYLAGLDNYWTLFATLPKFNHWFVIKAKYADGTERLLPLPMQGERNFWQRYFVDFRTAKFYLNIYREKPVLNRYARYLCRAFRVYNGSPAVSVTIELHHQNILPREVALERGTTMEPQAYSQVYAQASCTDPVPVTGGK